MAVSVAVAVYTLLPNGVLLAVKNQRRNAGLTLDVLVIQRLLQTMIVHTLVCPQPTDSTMTTSVAVAVYNVLPQVLPLVVWNQSKLN